MLEALERKRGKGPQVVRVERVVVQEGGRAIVGNVQAGAAAAGPIPSPPRALEQAPASMTLDGLRSPEPAVAAMHRDPGGGK